MKKWLMITLLGALVTTATACGSGGGNENSDSQGKKALKDGKTVVTLSLQENSPFYQAVEKKFEEKYPDIDLKIESYKNIDEQWGDGDYEKYKKTTNTAVLSGKGADIIELGSLPVEEYISKKVLLDMNDLLEQDNTLKKDDLQMGVLEALKTDGGLYAIPSGFFMRAFVGDGDILKNSGVKVDDKNWDWNKFEQVSKEIIQQSGSKSQLYALANNPPEVTLQEMIVENYTQFVDSTAKKAKFDSPDFVELIQQVKKMYDEKVMTSELAEMGNQLFYSTVLLSPSDFIDGPYSSFQNPVLLQKPHKGSGGRMRIIQASQFGIQAKSAVKDEAWKFISFLLSDEVQSMQDREGFSLITSVNDKKMDDIQAKVKNGEYKLPDGKTAKVADEAFDQFKQLIHTADQYSSLDGKVVSIIGEESHSFFSGQKSAEEVAKLIQNRVTTYLNE